MLTRETTTIVVCDFDEKLNRIVSVTRALADIRDSCLLGYV